MNVLQQAPSRLITKAHFQILNGLRGIAAFAVVIFHFMEIVIPNFTDNPIAHGYLAVDFFFCLSGFVIAYAYDNRIETIGTWQFIKLRLIRLQPLVVIGSVLGLLTLLADPYQSLYSVYGFGKTLLMFVTSCLMIPYPFVAERFYNLFPLNPPTWSLLWEYFANISYAIILIKLPKKILGTLTIVAGLLLVYAAHHYTDLSVGWSITNINGGAIRVFYSFLIGILIYRAGWLVRSPLGFLAIGALLMGAFLVPYVKQLNWITESLIVLVYFTFLIALGAGAQMTTRLRATCTFLGDISYPLYMVHYPFLWFFMGYVNVSKPPVTQLAIIIPTATVLLVGLAYVIMVYVDLPIRTYLTARMKKSCLT